MIHEQSPFASFDDRAKGVVVAARQHAERLRSQVVEAEHVLLGLLAVKHGLAARAVNGLTGSAAGAATAITGTLQVGQSPSPSHIRFTAGCQQAITRAAQQALLLGDERIGTEHLLLGLLLETQNPAVRTLSRLGVDYQAAHAEIARLRAEDH